RLPLQQRHLPQHPQQPLLQHPQRHQPPHLHQRPQQRQRPPCQQQHQPPLHQPTVIAAPRQEELLVRVEELETENGVISSELTTLEANLTTLTTDYEQLQAMLGLENERLRLVANATRIVTIPGTDLAPDASATFYTDISGQIGLVLLRGLEAPASDETYQLWLIPAATDPILAGPVTVTDDGPDWTVVDIPVAAQNFDFIGVSLENSDWRPELGPTSDALVLLGSGTN
ncbi:MAG: anti-sigma factor, partial [Chloroflexota bacterium]